MAATSDVITHISTTGVTTSYQGRVVYTRQNGVKENYTANYPYTRTQLTILTLESWLTGRFPSSGWFN